MALNDLLNLSHSKETVKMGMSDERLIAAVAEGRKIISFFRWYPDLFVDWLAEQNPDNKFRFYYYQRVFLRACLRHRYVYATYPRAYSKSFLVVLSKVIKAILYPNSHSFVASGGKEQSSGILTEKVEELCELIPALRDEILEGRGKGSTKSKDYTKILFKNGSYIDNLAIRESTRGKRRTDGIIEEAATVDGTALNEIIIPTMNIDRLAGDGRRYENELLNKSQAYVTTAGYKNTYPYDKLIQVLVRSIIQPEKAIVLGGTWRIPVLEGLQSRNFVNDLKSDATFNEASFDREYKDLYSLNIVNCWKALRAA